MSERLTTPAAPGGATLPPAQARWNTRVGLGARIRNARLVLGMSPAELAQDLTSVPYLSRIEAGERRPSTALLTALAGRLGVQPSDLAPGKDTTPERLRFELAHADFLFASARFEDAARVGSDLADVASCLGRTEVADAARITHARAIAALGHRRAALRLLRDVSATELELPALVAAAGFHVAMSDYEGAIAVGRRAGQLIQAGRALSLGETTDLAVSMCAAYGALGEHEAATHLARLTLRLVLADDNAADADPDLDVTGPVLAVSYRTFEEAARKIERGVATLQLAEFREAVDVLRNYARSGPGAQIVFPAPLAVS